MKQSPLHCLLLMLVMASTIHGQDISDLIRTGKIREARVLLLKLEKENKSQESILFLKGLLSTQGDSAEYFYEAYLNKTPNGRFSDEALFRLAQIKYVQGLYRSAQKRFNQILQTRPLSPFKPKCLFWTGMCYLAMNQKDSAVVLFHQMNNEFPASEFKDAVPKDLLVPQPPIQTEKTESASGTEKKETTLPASPSYSIQIGAFGNQNNALLRKAFFEREGYPVFLKSKQQDNGVLYLVWVGSFASWEEAKNFGESIKTKYGTSYTLVSE